MAYPQHEICVDDAPGAGEFQKYVENRTERAVGSFISPVRNNLKEPPMKKIILAAALATLTSGAAFAQTTGPAGQQDTNKPGMANPSTEMNKGTTTGGMTTGGTTTGMSKDGMAKKGTSNTMNKGAESKDGDGMAKGGMKK
jgi:hypothetical protein